MAILSQISAAGSLAGNVFDVAGSLFPDTISIEETNSILFPDSVLLNVVTSETMNLELDITDKPIAPVSEGTAGGAGLDYASRRPVPLVLTGVLSNRTLSLIADPLGTLTQSAGSFAPGVFSALQSAGDLAGKFFDLGMDEIDQKLQLLYKWQTTVTPVIASGVRLDLNKISSDRSFTYIIKSINPISDLDNGDGVGITIVLESLLGQSTKKSLVSRGNSIADTAATGLNFATGKVNPFN